MNAVWNFSLRKNEVVWQSIRIKVCKVLQHCEGKVFAGVDDASAGTRPAAPKTIASFTVKSICRECEASEPVHSRQLTPP